MRTCQAASDGRAEATEASIHVETHARNWVFTKVVNSINGIVFEVREVSNEEFEVRGRDDLE